MSIDSSRRLVGIAGALLLAVTLAACGGDNVGGYTQEEVIESLKDELNPDGEPLFTNSDDVAECIGEKVYATGDDEVVKAMMETGEDEDLPEAAVGPSAQATTDCVDLKEELLAQLGSDEADGELLDCIDQELDISQDAALQYWEVVFSGGDQTEASGVTSAINDSVAVCTATPGDTETP